MCPIGAACVMLMPHEMEWGAASPMLPPGVKVAVLEGDPRETGPFTMRLSFPAGTRVEPHFHPEVEHATILSGTVSFGMGTAFAAASLRRMPVGSFIVVPAGLPHFGIVEEDAVIQAHGMGPWQTTYVNR